ncbi:ABC transporter permease [Demequina sp.]|uniref:ABC transporter permease n=1 Tax=Demequina sp. TaxID=2050685 RepID=UPI003D148130
MTKRLPARFLLIDAAHRLRSPLTPTLVSILILAGATIAVFATTGIALASQQATIERINSPEGRLITVSDVEGKAGLSSESIPVIASISGVEWTFAVGPALDVRAAAIPGGATAAARYAYGSLPPVLMDTTATESLAPGMALAGPGVATKLGLTDGVGTVSTAGRSGTVVGQYEASAPLGDLNYNVLIEPIKAGRVLTLWVEVDDVAQLPAVTDAVRAAVIAHNPGALSVKTNSELAELSSDISAGLARSAVLTVSALLATVFVLVGAVEYARVSGSTRDIGRRRALGATRSVIVLQVISAAGLSAVAGVVIGLAAGVVVTAVAAGALPSWEFALAVVTLMFIAALAGAVPPAIRAARLDPVKVLRVP